MKIKTRKWLKKVYYEGDGVSPPPPSPPPPSPPPPAAPPTPWSAGDGKVVFTPEQQAFINDNLGRDKAKLRETAERQARELETLKTTSSMTSKEKDELQKRIDQLRTEHMSKDEVQQSTFKKEITRVSEEAKQYETDARRWKTQFEQTMVHNEILSAAGSAQAFSAEQIKLMYAGSSKVLPVIDKDGKETGKYEVKMTINVGGKTLELSPVEALKQLRESDEYANLFKFEGSGGVGGRKPSGVTGTLDLTKLTDPVYYKENYKEIRAAMSRGELQ